MSEVEQQIVHWPDEMRSGTGAVIFVSQRTADDEEGYARAGEAMDRAARAMPGFVGVDSVRDANGLGITVSYWADETSAVAWRQQADHTLTREAGRQRWYEWYRLAVTETVRSYDWSKQR